MNRRSVLLFAILVLFAGKAEAQISLPQIIGNNMVLQCNKALPVWGYASPGEKVTVKFNAQTKQTTTDANGRWQVLLNAMPACNKPAVMTITGSNTIALKNILVGEVWLCSGQSN